MVEQIYIDVIVEAICSEAVWLYKPDVTYYSLLAFGGFDNTKATWFAILGASLGSISNFWIGWALSWVHLKGKSVISPERYAKWQKNAYFLAPLVAIFSWISYVGALVVALGFFRVKPIYVMPMLIVAQVVYYLYQLEQAGGF